MDENKILEKIEKFGEQWEKKHPMSAPAECHNIYYLVSEDRDGNITGEAYGVNCMTDFAFSKAWVELNADNISDAYYKRLFIGNGLTTPQPSSSKEMESYIEGGTGSTNNYDRIYTQVKYNPTSQILTYRERTIISVFDYTQFNEDKTITELGIGRYNNYLVYHARVYDSEGNPSSFVKRMNERLSVYVYVTLSCKPALIIDRNWNKGIYTMFRPYYFMKYRYEDTITETVIKAIEAHTEFFRSSYTTINLNSFESRTLSNNVATVYDSRNRRSYLLEGSRRYLSDMLVGSGGNAYYDDFDREAKVFMISKPKLSTPEKIETDRAFTDEQNSSQLFKIFGQYSDNYNHRIEGRLPVVDFDISGDGAGVWLFNVQEMDFTIPVNYNNTKNAAYDCQYLSYSMLENEYVDFLGVDKNFRVWMNMRPDIPITKIKRTAMTIYATDTYWDTSSWEQILNLDNVSQSLGTKRYYVWIGDTPHDGDSTTAFPINGYMRRYCLPVERDQQYHSLICRESPTYCNYGNLYKKDGGSPWAVENPCVSKAVTSNNYGYIAMYNWLVYPDTDDPNPTLYTNPEATDNKYWYRYNLTGIENAKQHYDFIWNTRSGDKILIQGIDQSWTKGVRVYTPNIDPSIAPTYEDVLYTTRWSDGNPFWSFSDMGFHATSYISGNVNVHTTYVIDVHGGPNNDTAELITITGYDKAAMIELTGYLCGVNVSIADHLSLDVIDVKTQTVYKTIDFLPGYTFDGICGFDNFIYIRVINNSVASTWLYVIDREELIQLTVDIPQIVVNSNSFYNLVQRAVPANGNVESCMVIGGSWDHSSSYNMLIKASSPETPIRMLDDGTSEETCRRINNQAAQLAYTDDNKQLLFIYTTKYRMNVIDVGRVLNKGTLSLDEFCLYRNPYQDSSYTNHNYTGVVFKKRIARLRPALKGGYEYSSTDPLWWSLRMWLYPIENFVPFKLVGYTKTICSYNNPKYISCGKGITYQMANDSSIWSPPT